MRFIIFFDGQFWCGISEIKTPDLKVKKYIFGNEPGDGEILEFVNKRLFSETEDSIETIERDYSCEKSDISPKRMKRIVAKEMKKNPISTKSQEALSKSREENKRERKEIHREEKLRIIQEKREKKIAKRKAQKRGK